MPQATDNKIANTKKTGSSHHKKIASFFIISNTKNNNLKMSTKISKDPMEWELIESEKIFNRPWLTARRDHVKLPTGVEINEFYVLEYPDFCNVIAITKKGKYILERQYRHAQRLTALEIPAGCVEQGENPMDAAKRELYEETGYAGGEWYHLMTISPNAGACTNYSYSFVAVGVEKVSTQHLEKTEDIKIVLTDEEEVVRMLKNDEFHQAMMAAPLWKYMATKGLI
jgi:8-oxo-dGTP pyrophosphatase MutT (NUDIX family)